MSKNLRVSKRDGSFITINVDDDFDSNSKLAIHSGGYVTIRIQGKSILLHRYLMGNPKGMDVDHINRDKNDYRKSNLRAVSHRQNSHNTKRNGVYFRWQNNKYHARIKLPNKRVHIGYYEKEEDAIKAYRKAHADAFGEFSPYYEYYSGITKEVN